jgi:hypothetical protein
VHPHIQALSHLAKSQTGTFTAAEAATVGVPSSTLSRWLAGGLIERAGTHRYKFAGHTPSWHERIATALLDTAPRSWLTGTSAARFHGFDGFGHVDEIRILVPRSHRGCSSVGATVTSSRSTKSIDCTTVDGTRVTSPSRTIIELARTCTKQQMEQAVDSAVRDGGTSPVYLAKRLAALRGPGRTGVRLIDSVLIDTGGTNALERRFLKIVREAGLPKPTCQVIHKRDGKTIARVDFQFLGTSLVVEVDGQVAHATPRQRQRDAQRRRELDDIGLRVLTFVHDDVFNGPERVRFDLVRAFRAGPVPWRGKLPAQTGGETG